MTAHEITIKTEANFDFDEIELRVTDEIADRLQKASWYHEIRDHVEERVQREVDRVVAERIALVLDRGITVPDSRMRPGLGLNAQTGAGRDWRPTMPLDEYIDRVVRRRVDAEVTRRAEAAS